MIGDVATGRAAGSARDLPDQNESAESDEAVVASAQADPAAFAALYVRYVDLVYRYCYRRLGDRMAAEDATSRIFERALRALPKYRAGSFRSWLFTIARNTITDLYRSERKEQRFPHTPDRSGHSSLADLPEQRPGPEQQAIAADDACWVRGLLTHLTEEQRRVVELRLAGLTDIEIASVLGQSRGSVRTAQYRAIQKLRTILVPDAGPEAEHERHTGVDPRGKT